MRSKRNLNKDFSKLSHAMYKIFVCDIGNKIKGNISANVVDKAVVFAPPVVYVAITICKGFMTLIGW
jgi:hypothetical protein